MAEPGQQDTAPFTVRADHPVEMHNPVRRARILAVLTVAAIIASSFAAGYIGYRLADANMNRRVSALEASRAQIARERTAQIQQLRNTTCVALNRLPPDPAVDQQRALYGCGPRPPRPTPTPGPTGGGGSGGSPGPSGGRHIAGGPPAAGGGSTGRPGGPSGPTPQPAPPTKPAPSPTPAPAPTPQGGGLTLCLPLLGCLIG